MFANCQIGGVHNAIPDVCKTPAPPAPFVPIPYPNIAIGPTVVPPTASLKVLLTAGPAHNLMSTIPMSNGDQPGVLLGMISQLIMGPSRHMMGSTNVLYGGSPATKMTMPTAQNGFAFNAVGTTIVPAQFKILLMR